MASADAIHQNWSDDDETVELAWNDAGDVAGGPVPGDALPGMAIFSAAVIDCLDWHEQPHESTSNVKRQNLHRNNHRRDGAADTAADDGHCRNGQHGSL